MSGNNLKISLEELRNRINVEKKEWINYCSTNCYAYALGLDVPEHQICNYAYEPGIINNTNNILKSCNCKLIYNDLLNYLYNDFSVLGINFREIYPNEKIKSYEWKIALYTEFAASTEDIEFLFDFHFLRQNKNGVWYHKMGWNSSPNNFDSNKKVITNLDDCYIQDYKYQKCFKLNLR